MNVDAFADLKLIPRDMRVHVPLPDIDS
jgi:hypothetical protein